jgi:NADH dehydrogenase
MAATGAFHPPLDDADRILAAADKVYIDLPFFPRD